MFDIPQGAEKWLCPTCAKIWSWLPQYSMWVTDPVYVGELTEPPLLKCGKFADENPHQCTPPFRLD